MARRETKKKKKKSDKEEITEMKRAKRRKKKSRCAREVAPHVGCRTPQPPPLLAFRAINTPHDPQRRVLFLLFCRPFAYLAKRSPSLLSFFLTAQQHLTPLHFIHGFTRVFSCPGMHGLLPFPFYSFFLFFFLSSFSLCVMVRLFLSFFS